MNLDSQIFDFNLLNSINKQIAVDEHVNGPELPAAQSSKFTEVSNRELLE
jgi:hypothetical protein